MAGACTTSAPAPTTQQPPRRNVRGRAQALPYTPNQPESKRPDPWQLTEIGKNGGSKMEKWTELLFLIILVLAVVSVILASGCTSSSQPSDNGGGQAAAQPPNSGQQDGGQQPSGYGNTGPSGQGFGPRGNYSNITGAQRQQMEAERMQQAAAACGGMSEGDSCTTQPMRGNRTGTCTSQNGTLYCMTAGFGNFTGNFSGNFTGYGGGYSQNQLPANPN